MLPGSWNAGSPNAGHLLKLGILVAQPYRTFTRARPRASATSGDVARVLAGLAGWLAALFGPKMPNAKCQMLYHHSTKAWIVSFHARSTPGFGPRRHHVHLPRSSHTVLAVLVLRLPARHLDTPSLPPSLPPSQVARRLLARPSICQCPCPCPCPCQYPCPWWCCQLPPVKQRRLSHRRYPHRRVSHLQMRASSEATACSSQPASAVPRRHLFAPCFTLPLALSRFDSPVLGASPTGSCDLRSSLNPRHFWPAAHIGCTPQPQPQP